MKTEARLALARSALYSALDAIGTSNVLVRPATFEVWPEVSDPHEAGPLQVVLEKWGIRVSWLGCEDDPWEISWKALRRQCDADGEYEDLLEAIDDAKRELSRLTGEGHVVASITPAADGDVR